MTWPKVGRVGVVVGTVIDVLGAGDVTDGLGVVVVSVVGCVDGVVGVPWGS